MSTSSGIRPNEVSTSSGISPKSSEIKQPSYLELDLIYGDGPAECAERLNNINNFFIPQRNKNEANIMFLESYILAYIYIYVYAYVYVYVYAFVCLNRSIRGEVIFGTTLAN